MRVLVVGSNGLLGSNAVYAARKRNWMAYGTYHTSQPELNVPVSQFSLEADEKFDDLLTKYDPEVVINCAAMTDVDRCEKHPDQAFILNGREPGKLAARCRENDIKFVHISTDYVFEGEGQTQYDESAEPNPIQVYGKSKLAGERSVREEHPSPLILRLSFVWGIHRSTGDLTGFPSWVHDRLCSGDSVPLFSDQWVTPTRAGQAAETILDLVDEVASGHHHVACNSCVTPYEFGKLFAERVDRTQDRLIEESTNDVERKAPRPSYSCLSVEKVEEELGRPQPTLSMDIDMIWDLLEQV